MRFSTSIYQGNLSGIERLQLPILGSFIVRRKEACGDSLFPLCRILDFSSAGLAHSNLLDER